MRFHVKGSEDRCRVGVNRLGFHAQQCGNVFPGQSLQQRFVDPAFRRSEFLLHPFHVVWQNREDGRGLRGVIGSGHELYGACVIKADPQLIRNDSDLATSTLLRTIAYPDSVNGGDAVTLSYNRQGELATATDQRGCVHTYDRDLLGRLAQDRVTTLGTGWMGRSGVVPRSDSG